MALPATASTKSTSTTEAVRGEHRFEITDYSAKLGAGRRRVLTSDTFSVGDQVLEDHVSAFVRLVTPNATAWALYDLRLVDPATGRSHSVRRRSRQPVAFDSSKAKKRERGVRRFMPRLKLQNSFVRDYRLAVECVLDVVQDTFVSATAPSPGPGTAAALPVTDLAAHLGALFLRTLVVGADVTFVVQGEAFQAHRVVLAARSPVFRAELSGGSSSPPPAKRDGEASEIFVDGMKPQVFRALLHFIYTDALPDDMLLGCDLGSVLGGDLGSEENRELVRGLLAGAERYGMGRLKKICELVLSVREPLDAKILAAALDPCGQHRHCIALGVDDGCVEFTLPA